MAWLSKAFDWFLSSKPAQLVLAAVGFLLAFKTVQWKARMDGEAHQKLKDTVESGKETARVVEAGHTEIREIEDAKDAALAAPITVPVVSTPDELRRDAPEIARVILRPRGQGDVPSS